MGNAPILLVEDNPDDVELTLLAFQESSMATEVVAVRDGVEALDYLFCTGAHAGRDPRIMPALILLDLNMPRLSGIDTLRRIRADARTRMLPVVMLTSSNEDRDIVESYGLGANSYIRKPVDFARFVDTAKQLGLYWLLLNVPPPGGRSGPGA